MFDNCFNILLHSKVLNNTFSYSFLNFNVFYVLKANYFISYLFSFPQSVIFRFYMLSQGRKKHMARPGLEPRTSRIPCKISFAFYMYIYIAICDMN